MTELKHQSILVLGDWSGDGHGKDNEVRIFSNKTVEEIREGYAEACRITGILFHVPSVREEEGCEDGPYAGPPDFTNTMPFTNTIPKDATWTERQQWKDKVCQFCAYGQYHLNEYGKEALKDYPSVLDALDGDGDFSEGWFQFVKIGMPDFEWRLPEKEEEPPRINGYWQKGWNCQIGYGLFG